MNGTAPKVSLGLPVYNGERYLEACLETLINQSFSDFELIVCDNASTDATPRICRALADRDPRVRYRPSDRNRGAAFNYNRTFDLARGRYFKWCAHDDLVSPDFLECCVAVLDAHADTVLAYAPWVYIDAAGDEIPAPDVRDLGLDIDSPGRRFSRMVDRMGRCTPVFGLIRTEALRRTRLIGAFPHADRVTLLELSLLGKFRPASQARFYLRMHEGTSMAANKGAKQMNLWYDTAFADKPRDALVGLVIEKCRSVSQAPVAIRDKVVCWNRIARFAVTAGARRLGGRLQRGFG